ncbi:hypothetical protein JQX13_35745 [Archangium violaceum]|uniref:hypothetical protein n=1 Tax=Archangium violaceum TaxID=83451 RepID=UPI00193B467A|nr:hypothetical protein [Archangium violaceum]QRK05487.1 hypothetical protein JQX13_35745 [Archangium violaceum]
MGRSRRFLAFTTVLLWSCSSSGGQPTSSVAGAAQVPGGQQPVGAPPLDQKQDTKIEKELAEQGLLLVRDKAGKWQLGTRKDGKLLLSKPFAEQDKSVDLLYEQPRRQTLVTIRYKQEDVSSTSHEITTTTHSLDVDFRDDVFVVSRWKLHQSTIDVMADEPRQEKFTEQAVDLIGRTFTKVSGLKGTAGAVSKSSSMEPLPNVSGALLVAGSDFDERLVFREFLPVYGEKSRKDDSDLSAQLVMSWGVDRIRFKLKVRDDFVRFGKSIHADHLELWGLIAGGWQNLVYFDEDKIWLVSANSPTPKGVLRGEYALTDDPALFTRGAGG